MFKSFRTVAAVAIAFVASTSVALAEDTKDRCFPQDKVTKTMDDLGYRPVLVGLQSDVGGKLYQVIYAYHPTRKAIGVFEVNRPDGNACLKSIIGRPHVSEDVLQYMDTFDGK